MKGRIDLLSSLCCALALAACGGGGGGSQTYSIGVTVTGLSGTVVLQNNGVDNLTIAANGIFAFPAKLASANSYAVTIKSPPAGQSCAIANGVGTVAASNVTNVAVTCSTVYTVGGTVTGLQGTLVLQQSGGQDTSVSSNGPFTIGPSLLTGTVYSIAIKTQPTEQVCVVANGTGTVGAANVVDITVTCSLVPLTLMGSTPASGALNVSRSTSWALMFSTTLAAATVSGSAVSLTSASGSQAVSFTVSGNQITITPINALLPLSTYNLVIGKGIRGSQGEQLANPVVISATTEDRGWGVAGAIEVNAAANQAFGPTIAFAPTGDALAVWYQYDGTRYDLWSNSFSSVNHWGTAVSLYAGALFGSVEPRVVFDATGDVTLVWRESVAVTGTLTSIYSMRYTPAGGWNPAAAVESNLGSAAAAQVAGDAAGNAVATWFQFNGTNDIVWANRFTPQGGWGIPVSLQTGTNEAVYPQIAMNAAGAACAVWSEYNGFTNTVRANNYGVGMGWSGESVIQADNVNPGVVPQVGIDAANNCIRIWQELNGAHTAIFASRLTPGSGAGTVSLIASDSLFDLVTPQVATNAGGDSQAIWLRREANADTLWAAHYTVAGSWELGVALQVSPANSVSNPAIAVDAGGNALAVWQELSAGTGHIWASRYIAAQGWSVAKLIGPAAGNSANPRVTFDSNGRAIAVWEQIDAGSVYDIWADRFE